MIMVLPHGWPFHLLRLCPEALSVAGVRDWVENVLFTWVTYYGLFRVGKIDISLGMPTVLGNRFEVGHFVHKNQNYLFHYLV
jgi:hypothetical protein